MRLNLLLAALLTLALTHVNSQTFINETFSSGQMPPPGWTIDQYSTYWTISQSSIAGGVSPEGRFSYSTATPITTRLISPEVDLTGLASIKLTFSHFFDWFASPGPTLGVATRTGSAGTWQTVWAITPIGNIGPVPFSLDINNSDVGSSEFQFCFFISGSTTMMDFWYVDDIMLLNPLEINAQLVTISQTPSTFSSPIEVKGTLRNLGSDTITTAEISWQTDGGTIYNTILDNLSLKTLDSYDFSCNDLMNTSIGLHSLRVWVGPVNGETDQEQSNDTLAKTVNKVCYTVPKIPLFEEFTSSTCIPCAFFNSDFVPWCEEHEEEITLIKYQMNFPGAGDPYYIEECGDRANYYGVTWVPWLVGNGSFVDTEMNDVNTLYETESTQAGLMKIQATHTLSGQNITVNVNVLPFVNQSSSSLFIAVVEELTYGNTGNNGENSFEHVMMKMIPSSTGIPVNFQERVPYSYSQTVDLSNTNIETWNDIRVVAWVQKNASRKIFQSAYSTENASLNSEDRLFDILLDGTSLAGFNPDQLSYYYGVAQGAAVPEVAAVPLDSSAIVIVIPALSIPGTTTLDVYAENIQYHKQYKLNFLVNTGLDEKEGHSLSVYPNPASDYIQINGADNYNISVSDAVGRQHRVINNFTGSRINLTGLPAGIYLLKAEKQGYAAINKKFIITK
jgi:hypothetical protein